MEYVLSQLGPLALLLAAVAIVIFRLPKVELGHAPGFVRRRVMNWLPLGLTYAFLYMGRYNIKVSQSAFGDIRVDEIPLMTNQDFATIFLCGTVIYGVAFVVNGPLTDRIGGRAAILIGAGGTLVANFAMGVVTLWTVAEPAGFWGQHLTSVFAILYTANMYFQSFGAVAVVKVNAPWFHLRERGVFGAIFGILISLGVFFAYDGSHFVLDSFGLSEVFFVPAGILLVMWIIVWFNVRDTPGQAGFEDFDTADADLDGGVRLGVVEIFKRMLSNPVIMTIAAVEFCSGFLRQAIMQWYQSFAKQTDSVLGLQEGFVNQHWGLLLACAGILGGVTAGVISDKVFDSRRGPVAAVLYGFMSISAIALVMLYTSPAVGIMVIAMSLAVIGVHGMLSGTASMDFGGKRNVGTAVGIIDGFVYLGTGFMSLLYGFILPNDTDVEAAANPENWIWWPVSMIPVALIGTYLALRLWNAKPTPKAAPKPAAGEEA